MVTRRRWRRPVGIDELLNRARRGLGRVSPPRAAAEIAAGSALLVDIRPAAQRAAEGEVDPAYRPLVIERNVLEWRLGPRSDARRGGGGGGVGGPGCSP